ncbi:MAG: hypothetical protein FGM41_08965 [Bacteroidetes bacterium]|jgi:hypothetical protein|nr:hypothetical protein [Bacteroidota bacterium]
MRKITLMIAALAFLTVSSCKKEDEKTTPTPTKSKTELLTAKAWKMTAMTVNPGISPIPGGPTITDLYAFMEACEKDNTEKFNTGGTGVTDEGATKCDPTDPQTENFTWAFASNETKIVIDSESIDIVQLDETTAKFTNQIDGSELGGTAGTMYTLTVTFKNN